MDLEWFARRQRWYARYLRRTATGQPAEWLRLLHVVRPAATHRRLHRTVARWTRAQKEEGDST